jgi:1,4-dihydroxy-2-naphthoate octaprenyltransferase
MAGHEAQVLFAATTRTKKAPERELFASKAHSRGAIRLLLTGGLGLCSTGEVTMSDPAVSRLRLWYDAFRGFYRRQVDIKRLDSVSRWLYAGRFLILVISVQAAVIATLLAVPSGLLNWWLVLPLAAGFVVVHAISNFSNDYFGFIRGHDTPDSPRVTYTIHPLAHGVLTKRSLKMGILILWLAALVIGAFFFWMRGWPVLALFAAGAGFLYLYDAAPQSLKAMGLGELAAFLVWGPLMIGGGYYSLTGIISWQPLAVSVPYGLGIAAILIGKHIDQAEFDGAHTIRTLPVLMGERGARLLNRVIVVLMYLLVAGLVAVGALAIPALLVFAAAPQAWKLLTAASRPRPAAPPEGYVGWPLWLHRFNLVHNRRFGWLFILGIGLGDVWLAVVPLFR